MKMLLLSIQVSKKGLSGNIKSKSFLQIFFRGSKAIIFLCLRSQISCLDFLFVQHKVSLFLLSILYCVKKITLRQNQSIKEAAFVGQFAFHAIQVPVSSIDQSHLESEG